MGNINSSVGNLKKFKKKEKPCCCLHHDWIFSLLLEIVNGTLVPENVMETQDTNVLSNGLPEILVRVNMYSYLRPTIGKLIGEWWIDAFVIHTDKVMTSGVQVFDLLNTWWFWFFKIFTTI